MTEFGRNEYNEAKKELDKANEKSEKLIEKGIKIFDEIVSILEETPKFIGYRTTHNYRADNNVGNTLIGNDIFIIDPEFKQVLYKCEVEEYNQIQEAIKQFEEQIRVDSIN